MKQKAAKLFLSILPQNKISSLVGKAGRSKISKWTIKPYARFYKINVNEMEKPIDEYQHLTEFFSRRLKQKARQIEGSEHSVISPVDGVISQMGGIHNGAIIQAKGISYSAASLLGEEKASTRFDDGSFITIYLSPQDYHRIHMPMEGTIKESIYIPGRLFPVNEIGVSQVKGLFTKNERVVSFADTKAGAMAIVKVGAFIVGSVKVGYTELERKWKKAVKQNMNPAHYQKGEEIGHFEFGSTVILLFEKGRITFDSSLSAGMPVKMGQVIGELHEKKAHDAE